MGYVSPRVFGGIGFSIEHPVTVFQIEQSDKVAIHGLDKLDREARDDLNHLVHRMKEVQGNTTFRVVLKSSPPQHVGFGSKTSLALALIAGVNAVNRLGWSTEEMQRVSGRGGASGVGVHAFFNGGVIWDVGHSAHTTKQLVPSGSSAASAVPPLMVRLSFPETWRIVLVLPEESTMTGEEEVRFFADNTPIPPIEALSTMAALYHGVLPAIMLADYKALASALGDVHRVGFKDRELRRWSVQTRTCIDAFFEEGLAAGMSSVGPLIYAIIPDNDKYAFERVQSVCKVFNMRMFALVKGWNSGYEVRLGVWP